MTFDQWTRCPGCTRRRKKTTVGICKCGEYTRYIQPLPGKWSRVKKIHWTQSWCCHNCHTTNHNDNNQCYHCSTFRKTKEQRQAETAAMPKCASMCCNNIPRKGNKYCTPCEELVDRYWANHDRPIKNLRYHTSEGTYEPVFVGWDLAQEGNYTARVVKLEDGTIEFELIERNAAMPNNKAGPHTGSRFCIIAQSPGRCYHGDGYRNFFDTEDEAIEHGKGIVRKRKEQNCSGPVFVVEVTRILELDDKPVKVYTPEEYVL